MNKWSGKINKSYPLWFFEPPIHPCWSGPPVMKARMFSPWLSSGRTIKKSNGKGEKPREYNCMDWSIDKYCSDTSQEKGYSASLLSHAQPNTHRFIIIFDSKIEMIVLSTCLNIWAATWDFQQCGILTWIDWAEPAPPPFELRNSKCCSVSSLTVKEYSSV